MTARLALAAMLAEVLAGASEAQPGTGAVIVLPFENPRADPRLHWMREGVAVLVSDVLDAGGAEVVGRDERDSAFERLQLPLLAPLSRASAIKVGQAVGAATVVVGRVELVEQELLLSARLVSLDAGRLSPEATGHGPVSDLFSIAARVATALAGTGETPPRWQAPPSLAAFELFIKGLIAEAPAAQRASFEQALDAAPAYDAVRLALWRLHTEQGEHQRALERVTAVGVDSPVSREARFAAAMSLLSLKRDDDAFAALRALQDAAPLAAVANALGVLQLRRGSPAQSGRATFYFNQATEIDPLDADYFFNLGYAYLQEKDPRAAAYWLREAVRREPADGDAHFVLAAALQLAGATTEAARERELARRLSSRYEALESRAAGGGDPVPRGLERLRDRLDRPSARVDTFVTASGQRDQAGLAAFHLDAGRRAFDREADREAAQELRRALYLSPYLAEAHLLLGRIHLRGGRAEDAVQTLKIAIWSEESAAAHAALAEAFLALEDVPAARAALDRALALDPRSAEAAALKARLPVPR
ncbi:MAG: tetratricopeptide repeat protein [Vicinamibacterales bacterium]